MAAKKSTPKKSTPAKTRHRWESTSEKGMKCSRCGCKCTFKKRPAVRGGRYKTTHVFEPFYTPKGGTPSATLPPCLGA